MKKQPRSFQVVGPAPAGFCCALCHQGGSNMLEIIWHRGYSGYVGIWHRTCAQKYFRAPVLEPRVAAVLERT